ncbi:hypothetical protein CR205_13315 [Alteribacter lacisalsi]|uniref:Tripartite tricarboxylate transporter substrate binding protein n=1 Tax=Alteribacter lacisalsi TaxID=2045244 RepID=A0A2W0H4B5_9BACI|nr:tripartite tricarboxylate transporter substrate binding protein [Alteribacter lacisalsi]PYZ96673.1 hypothetical protein CR205_13315 [Alteribacter lacisalsi]
MKKYLMLSISCLIAFTLTACNDNDPAANAGVDESNSNDEAGNFPSRDIDILVGFGAGGGTDNFARAVGQELSDILDVNVNVINQEGAAGVIAGEHVASQPADGHTIWAISSFPVTSANGTNKNDLEVMKPIARVQNDTYTLQVKDGTFETVDELVAHAEENPGGIQLGGVGTLGINDISARSIMEEMGIDMNYVSFEGAGQMHAALLGGHIDVMLEAFAPTMPQIEGGEIDPLVVFAEDRVDAFPDVPASAEKGWDFYDGVERGFAVRRDTPEEIIEKIESAVREAVETTRYQEYAANSYLDLRDGWLDSDEYEERLETIIEEYAQVLSEIE